MNNVTYRTLLSSTNELCRVTGRSCMPLERTTCFHAQKMSIFMLCVDLPSSSLAG